MASRTFPPGLIVVLIRSWLIVKSVIGIIPDVPDVPEYRQKASKFYSKDRGVQDLMTYSSY